MQHPPQTGLPVVTELMSADKLDEFVEHVDVIQIGARNMQNFDLLKAVGKTNKPVLLKRGLANTIEEWIMSAEYILSEGNTNVMLCERPVSGICSRMRRRMPHVSFSSMRSMQLPDAEEADLAAVMTRENRH